MTGDRPLGALQTGDPGQLGSYLIRARIGAGGMGVVYLAEAPNGRPAAIKVIQAVLARDPRFRDRFRREVAAARRVRSRVTVAVLDADPDAECPWVAFEYVAGPNLEDVVSAGLPRLSATLGILTGIAEALVAIHQVGIIHRDLKPANVLCPPDGVKVIDFGIAAALDATATGGTGLLGTPAWLAPEQVTGLPLTPAVDVFAWGCVALYTLTGRLAFGGGDDNPHALMYRVVNVAPDLTGVPDELIEPVSEALRKRPEDRPAVGEILRMLLPSRGLDPPAPAGGPPSSPPGSSGPTGPSAAGAPPPAAAPPEQTPPPAWLAPPPAASPEQAPPPAWPPAPPPAASPEQAPPLAWPAPPVAPTRKKGRRALMIGIAAAAVVILVTAILIAVSGSHNPPPVLLPTTVPTTVTTVPAVTSTGSGVTAPPGATPLVQLLPHDVNVSTGCSQNQSSPNLTGLTTALTCSPSNLPGGQIFAFQFDSLADYATSLDALNKFKGFDSTTAGPACPPGNNAQDSVGWHSNAFPSQPGQILECLSVGTDNSQPDYIWTYPSENVIIDAQAAAHSAFNDLNNWWTTDSPPP